MPSSVETKLTTHLLSLPTATPYSAATQHPFLAEAGANVLPADRLALWLAQDYIYASAYPALLGRLLITAPPPTPSSRAALVLITDALSNIAREAGFFEDIAQRHGMQLDDWEERKATRDYTAEMVRATSGTFEEGMIFLWAMEKVYLDAWTYAGSHLNEDVPENAAIRELVANWTSPEFIRFVDALGDVVDGFLLQSSSSAWKSAERIWQRVLELEQAFWPEDGEECRMKITSA